MRTNLNNSFLDLYEELSELNEGDFLNNLKIKTLPLRATDITNDQTKLQKTVKEDDSVAKYGPYKELSDPSLKVGDQVKVVRVITIENGFRYCEEDRATAAEVIHIDAKFIYVQTLDHWSNLYKIRKSKI